MAAPRDNAALPSLRAPLAGVMDYAGIFPPAALTLGQSIRTYARHPRGREAWLLGRLCPAARLSKPLPFIGALVVKDQRPPVGLRPGPSPVPKSQPCRAIGAKSSPAAPPRWRSMAWVSSSAAGGGEASAFPSTEQVADAIVTSGSAQSLLNDPDVQRAYLGG